MVADGRVDAGVGREVCEVCVCKGRGIIAPGAHSQKWALSYPL